MKKNPITIGFDGARFQLDGKRKTTPLIGVVCQGTRLVKVVQKDIKIDGDDSTDVIIELVKNCENDVQYILTHTITFAGFNIADIEEINHKLKIPVIAITERMVNLDEVKAALTKSFPVIFHEKIKKILKAGNLYETKIKTHGGLSTVYFHALGINPDSVDSLLEKICIDSKIPESVRMAHIIGSSFKF